MDTRLRPMTAIALTRTLSPTSLTTSNINLKAVVPQHLIYLLTHNFCFLWINDFSKLKQAPLAKRMNWTWLTKCVSIQILKQLLQTRRDEVHRGRSLPEKISVGDEVFFPSPSWRQCTALETRSLFCLQCFHCLHCFRYIWYGCKDGLLSKKWDWVTGEDEWLVTP